MSNQTSIQKPSKVTRAQERLQIAVERLEKAVAGQNSGTAVAVPVGNQDNSELLAVQEEARQLRQENAALKQEISALKRVHEQVSSRLDATIERLSATLGE